MAIAKHSFPLGGFQDARKPVTPEATLTTLAIFVALMLNRVKVFETLVIFGAILSAQVSK